VKKSELRKILLNDFFAFVMYMDIQRKGKSLVPDHWLYRKVCNDISQLDKNTMILLPRRHLKTLIASLFITWYIIKYPNNAVMIITDTRKKGIKLLKGIKSFFLRHKGLKAIFPDRLAKFGNNEDTLTLTTRTTFAKEPNVAVYSIEQAIQSARADLLLEEDIISDKFVKSNANRDMVRTNLESLEAILESDSKTVVTGTRYTIDDPYGDIITENKETNEWNITSYGVYLEDGSPLCPYIMDAEEIRKKRKKHTPFFFASQYLNNPINNEINIFNIGLYPRYKTIPHIEYVMMASDLSDGEGGNKNTLDIIGVSDDGKYYLLDAYGNNRIDSENFYYVIRQYYELYKDKCLNIFIELNRNGKTILRDTFNRLKELNKDTMKFTGVNNMENKNIRIEKLEPLLRSGDLLLPSDELIKDGAGLFELIEELRSFNYTTTKNQDDYIDALSTVVVAIQRREVVKEKQEERKNRFTSGVF